MSSAKKPPQVPTESLPIYTWSPDQDGQPHVATIGNLPVLFRAPSSDAAAEKARDFRRAEMEKHERRQRNAAASSERMKARHSEKLE